MGRKHNLLIVFLLCFFIFTPSSVWSIMKAMGTEDLVKLSEIIVEGEVVHTESKWSTDGKKIVTHSVVTISEMLMGLSSQRTVIVETLGGEIGNIGLKVSNTAKLSVGEKVVLFLKSAKALGQVNTNGLQIEGEIIRPNVYRIVAKAQGKYTITSTNMAIKNGFTVIGETSIIDYKLPLSELKKKIEKLKK
jgi:hypothetical protein